jgi:Tol biopolymer transport system component
MLLFMVGLVAPANATFPGKNGKIAYSDSDVHTINPDGTGITTLIEDGAQPAWSADGKRIAFIRSGSIYIARADGTGIVRVTSGSHDWTPAWSPDGERITFVRTNSASTNDAPQIHLVNVDGSNDMNIGSGLEGEQYAPDWSPDGTKIAFMLFGPGCGDDIWVMNPDGSDRVRLTTPDIAAWIRDAPPCTSLNALPSWSPDGQRIAFAHIRNDPPYTGHSGLVYVYTIGRDGSGPTRIPYLGTVFGTVQVPAWSPDGQAIAWVQGYKSLYLVDAHETTAPDDQLPPIAFSGRLIAELSCCVHGVSWQPISGPRRSDYKNAARFCKAERDFLEEAAFAKKYGAKGSRANAYGKCVSQNT